MGTFETLEGFEHFSIAPFLGENGLVTRFGSFIGPLIIIGGALVMGYFVLSLMRKGQ